MINYLAELYCGTIYVGNGLFKTIEECFAFINKVKVCDNAVIFDNATKSKYTVKINHDC